MKLRTILALIALATSAYSSYSGCRQYREDIESARFAVGPGVPEVQKLRELGRQPPSQYMGTVQDLEDAKKGLVRFALDPSRGQILGMLVDTPTFQERIDAGGVIGYIIIALGALGLLIGFVRLVQLFLVGLVRNVFPFHFSTNFSSILAAFSPFSSCPLHNLCMD